MKITEVVSENNDLKEGLGSLIGKGIVKGASKIPGIGAAMAKASLALSKPDAIKKLATKWAEEAIEYGRPQSVNPADIERIVGREFAADSRVIKMAAEKFPGIANEIRITKGLSTAGQAVGQGYEIFKSTAGGALELAKTVGLVTPFYTYYKNMSAAQEKLDAGEFTQEQFDEARKIQLGLLVGNLAGAFVGSKVLAIPGKITGGILSKISGLIPTSAYNLIQSTLTGATTAAQTAFIYWLNSQEGRTVMATLMTSQVIEISGALTAGAIEKLKGAAESAKSAVTSTADQATTGQGAHASEQPPAAAQPEEPEAPAAKPVEQGTWVDVGSNLQQNTATGKTRIRSLR